jgi:site-specific DNA-methyltransferase (adenine-specific)
LHPIVIDEHNNLVAGERRLKACKKLGLEEIECKRKSELSDLEKAELELEENLMRKAFTWQEEVKGKLQIDTIKRKMYGSKTQGSSAPGWGIEDTAMALGQSLGSVSMDIKLARALEQYPKLAFELSKSRAYKKLLKLQEQILKAEIHKRMLNVEPIHSVIHGDCLEVMPTMQEEIHCIITDPPWGIRISQSRGLGRKSGADPFLDEPKTTRELIKEAYGMMYDVLEDDTHCYVFFAISQYSFHFSLLKNVGFNVDPLPLIWIKEGTSAPGVYTSFTNAYETIFFCRKGKLKLNLSPSNTLSFKRVPPKDKIHDTEKPIALIRHLIELSTLPGERVLDPFAGSGVVAEAAIRSGRDAIVIEKEEKYYHAICERMRQIK